MKAENQGITVMELGSSPLSNQFQRLSELLLSRLGAPRVTPVFQIPIKTHIAHQEIKRLK